MIRCKNYSCAHTHTDNELHECKRTMTKKHERVLFIPCVLCNVRTKVNKESCRSHHCKTTRSGTISKKQVLLICQLIDSCIINKVVILCFFLCFFRLDLDLSHSLAHSFYIRFNSLPCLHSIIIKVEKACNKKKINKNNGFV